MTRFYSLTVSDIRRETREAVVVTLTPTPSEQGKFRFVQGQYLTFRKTFDGEELRRSYSICSGVNDRTLRVGIKKVDGGWFSTWANDELQVGDTIEAMPPNGRFHSPIEPERRKHYLMFAIGSGITPVLSLIKTVLEDEPLSSVELVYGNRSVNTVMFREELDDLKNRFMSRFSLLHILKNDAGDIDLFNGRIDRQKCDGLFSTWIDVTRAELAFVCGPESMLRVVKASLMAHGMDEERIRYELFKSSRSSKARAVVSAPQEAGSTVEATIVIDGTARTITMRAEGASVLDAAIENDIDVPYSCRSGVCSTCSAKVVSGEVEMMSNNGLEDYEVERGLVLTCQSYPLTRRIKIDYDQH